MRMFNYYDESYQVAETTEEFLSLLKEGDVITSNHPFEGDGNAYYCGSVPTYIYGAEVREEDIKNAISTLPPSLELMVWRDSELLQFFYNANRADLTWYFDC